jgi:hypothetical protein
MGGGATHTWPLQLLITLRCRHVLEHCCWGYINAISIVEDKFINAFTPIDQPIQTLSILDQPPAVLRADFSMQA